jgi:hypothetical protein
VIRRGALAAALLAGSVAGCAYYNEMWSAERFAHDARQQEARGIDAAARLSWARAAAKAESVLVHHPKSRWADDALVLQGVGLARSGACNAAFGPLTRALREVTDVALRERAEVAAATCALGREAPLEAERLITPVRTSRDAQRRSQAAYIAGRAALARGDAATAAERFARSREPDAAPDRVRALAIAGRIPEAVAATDSLARRDDDPAAWGLALQEVARAGGAAAGADALDHLLTRSRLHRGDRARLLIEDGDRLRRAREFDRALARYDAAARLVPDSVDAGRAAVHALLAQAARARSDSDLDAVSFALQDLSGGLGGEAVTEGRELKRLLDAVRSADSVEVSAFRGAELARDSLEAPELAAGLFMQFAARYPHSLFAPKALIAAVQLERRRLDSVRVTLREQYPQSPYTLAFHGEASPAFQAVEDSLAIAFGVTRHVLGGGPVFAEGRFRPPHTGPRGPALEPPAVAVEASRSKPADAGPREQRPLHPGERPPKQPPADRPARPEVRP